MKRIISFILMLALALSLCACGQKEDEPLTWQEQYDLGLHYLEEGNYEQAILAFQAAIDIDPKRTEAYSGLANTYVALGEYDKAEEVWNRAKEFAGAEAGQTDFNAQLAHYQEARTFLESETPGLQILEVSFDKETYLRGEETVFQVTAVYRCPEGVSCYSTLSTNVGAEKPTWTKHLKETEKSPLTGAGILQQTVSIVPVQWGNGYNFCIGASIRNQENGEWYSDVCYITPEGNLSDHYAALNPFGATVFFARRNYQEFSEYTPEEQEFISALAAAVVANDTERVKALLGFKMESRGEFTTWNGYKVHFYSSGEDTTDEGDRSVSAKIELRPENGLGYFCRIYAIEAVATLQEDSWSDAIFIERVECPCIDWQWNGTMTYTDSYYHYQTWKDGETCNSEEVSVTTGTMTDSARTGVFTTETSRIEIWSQWPDMNDSGSSTETKEYQAGVLVAENGQAAEPDTRMCGLLGDFFVTDSPDSLGGLYW